MDPSDLYYPSDYTVIWYTTSQMQWTNSNWQALGIRVGEYCLVLSENGLCIVLEYDISQSHK